MLSLVAERFFGIYPISFKNSDNVNSKITFSKIQSDIPEFYSLDINNNRVVVKYADRLGLRNAIASINALIQTDNQIVFIQCCSAQDYPDVLERRVMFDLVSSHIPIDELKQYIKVAGFAKYNCAHLHIMDGKRYAIKSQVLPRLNREGEWLYTKEELIDLVKYANGLGIDLLPEIDIPGHSKALLERLPEMKCVKNGEPVGVWTICISREENYQILEKLVAELSEIFPYEYLHIGGDEISFYDLKHLEYWQHWNECDSCKKLFQEKGFKNETDGLYYFIRRMHAILNKYNKKMVIWSDSVDISKSPDIPRDILIQFWRVALPTRGPNKGCSMERFLEEGFKVLNAFFEETYIDIFVQEEKLKKWNPYNSPDVRQDLHHGIVGGEMCAWGYPVHYRFTLTPALCVFADRLWNSNPIEDKDMDNITSALTRQLLCTDVDMVNVFKLLGAIILPNNNYAYFYEDKVSRDEDLYDDAMVKLSTLISSNKENRQFVEAIYFILIGIRQFIRREKGRSSPDLTISAYITPLDDFDKESEDWKIWEKSMGIKHE
jgi:hypothetical protein